MLQGYHPYGPDQVWVSDITYLRTENGFIYLSLITDAYSRVIVGYHVSQHLKASGCIAALAKALKGRLNPLTELIHHSDRESSTVVTIMFRYSKAMIYKSV